MDAALPLALGSIKALLLLAAAAVAALALRGRPARVRAVVWSTALAGSLMIPAVAPLMPPLSVPVPEAVARLTAEPGETAAIAANVRGSAGKPVTGALQIARIEAPAASAGRTPDWRLWLVAAWAIGAALLLARLGTGLWRVHRLIRSAQPVTDPRWLRLAEQACRRVNSRRRIRLLTSPEVEVPATVGFLRPTIVLPVRAATWFDDRRRAVLQHEVIHVARLDWPQRLVARAARAAYWFNPLAWWAVRRLDLEQELACDEEVLALGTGASDYACHLLGIARHALPCPSPAIPALGMARRTHLEERIMTILKRSTHRRVGLAVIIPAALLTAAMVPALAAVYPSDPEPRPASSELKEILAEMEAAETRIEPQLAALEEIEINMEPQIEALEDLEVEIDHTKIAEIEEQMRPYVARLEAIEIDMEPFEAQMEALEKQLQDLQLHIEDGTLEEVQKQIQLQMQEHMAKIEDIHIDMEPYLKQIEAIHLEIGDLHERLADVHVDIEPVLAQVEKIHIDMEPFRKQMEQLHIDMEPFHREMERLGERLEEAIQGEVEAYLRSELGAVTSPGAPFDEAAARIADEANINVHDDVIRIKATGDEAREILTDLFEPYRIGTEKGFQAAIESAADGLSPLVIDAK